MVKYSYRALHMKFVQGSWIELCNNDCGTMVYFDKESNIVRNAQEADKDCIHKDVCDFLKDLRQGARAFNWYPSYVIDKPMIDVFKSLKEGTVKDLIAACEKLETVMKDEMLVNKQAKVDWDKQKERKLEVKKNSERAYEREQEQIFQWNRIKNVKETKAFVSSLSQSLSPRFTTADRL